MKRNVYLWICPSDWELVLTNRAPSRILSFAGEHTRPPVRQNFTFCKFLSKDSPWIDPDQSQAGLHPSLPDSLLHHVAGGEKTVVETPGHGGLGVGLDEAVEGHLPPLLGGQVEGGGGDGGGARQAGHRHLQGFPIDVSFWVKSVLWGILDATHADGVSPLSRPSRQGQEVHGILAQEPLTQEPLYFRLWTIMIDCVENKDSPLLFPCSVQTMILIATSF